MAPARKGGGAVISVRPWHTHMKHDGYTDEHIRAILEEARRVAVVGMSRSATKAAGHIPRYLAECGYDVVPVNPNADYICGHISYPRISEVEGQIDIVDVFRPSGQVMPIVREALTKHPRAIWLQEGIYSSEAAEMARQAGVPLIYDRCMMVEHQRLVGTGHI